MIKNLILCLSILFITLTGLKYRLRQYEYIPTPSTTFDEQGYLWLGKSILSTGIPANWSALDIYQNPINYQDKSVYIKNFNIIYQNSKINFTTWSKYPKPITKAFESNIDGYKSQFLLVQPYLDNPPFFGILLAIFDKHQTIFQSSVKNIRLIPIIFSSFTIFIIFIFLIPKFGHIAAFSSSLIYAVSPGYVISSRLALPENILSSIFLLSLLIVSKLKQKPKLIYVLALICFICPLIKIPGIIIPISLCFYFLYIKKYKVFKILFISSIFGLLFYFLYGIFFDYQTFFHMLQNQGRRQFQGPISVLVKIIYPQIPFPLFEGWILFGYISVLFLFEKKIYNQTILIISGIICHLLFFLIFGGNNFPWYQFLVFPLLSVCSGITISLMIKDIRFIHLLVFFIFVFSSLFYYYKYTNNWGDILSIFRMSIIIFLIIPGTFMFLYKNKLAANFSLILMIIFSLFFSIEIINNMAKLWPILNNINYPL